MTTAGHRDLIRAAGRDVVGHNVARLAAVNVQCDGTLVGAQAGRQREAEGGGRSPVASPSRCPHAKVNVVLKSQAQFQEVKNKQLKASGDGGKK